jgi:hypothetical protein
MFEPLGPGSFGQLPDEIVLEKDVFPDRNRNSDRASRIDRTQAVRISGTRCREISVADGGEIH